MYPLGWFWILVKDLLQIHPEVFNGVNVRGLGWPDHDFNVIVFKPLGCLLGSVFGVIVLLKHPFSLWHF